MRADGKKIKVTDPEYAIVPHIMVQRNDALNMIELDIPAEPEEMLSYFDAVEQFGSIEEESIFYGKIVIQKLKDVSSEKKRRAFLI